MNKMGENFDYDSSEALKVVIIGDASVGKTAIRQVYSQDFFPNFYQSTVLAEASQKTELVGINTEMTSVEFDIWEFPRSTEKSNEAIRIIFKNAAGVIIVIDSENRATLDSLETYIKQALKLAGNAKIFIAVNKTMGDPKFYDEEVFNITNKMNADAISGVFLVDAKCSKDSLRDMFAEIAQVCINATQEKKATAGISSFFFSQDSVNRYTTPKENPYLKIIDGYREKKMQDFDIIVKLLESYDSWVFLGWKHLKPQVEAILTLAKRGYYQGNSSQLLEDIQCLTYHPKYSSNGALAQIIEAIREKSLFETKDVEETKPSIFAASGQWWRAAKKVVAASNERLEAKYTGIFIVEEKTPYEQLILMLQTYIGSKISVNARSYSDVVKALLTLYQVNPEDNTIGILKQNAENCCNAILNLRNVDGYNPEQGGDLAAMIAVLTHNKYMFEGEAYSETFG